MEKELSEILAKVAKKGVVIININNNSNSNDDFGDYGGGCECEECGCDIEDTNEAVEMAFTEMWDELKMLVSLHMPPGPDRKFIESHMNRIENKYLG